MLNYLNNYGRAPKEEKFEDIDINDRIVLQDQINNARRNYSKLIHLYDEIQGDYLQVVKRLGNRYKEIVNESDVKVTSMDLKLDDEYMEIQYEQEAYQAGLKQIQMQLDFYKNDLRILNSVFYNKF